MQYKKKLGIERSICYMYTGGVCRHIVLPTQCLEKCFWDGSWYKGVFVSPAHSSCPSLPPKRPKSLSLFYNQKPKQINSNNQPKPNCPCPCPCPHLNCRKGKGWEGKRGRGRREKRRDERERVRGENEGWWNGEGERDGEQYYGTAVAGIAGIGRRRRDIQVREKRTACCSAKAAKRHYRPVGRCNQNSRELSSLARAGSASSVCMVLHI